MHITVFVTSEDGLLRRSSFTFLTTAHGDRRAETDRRASTPSGFQDPPPSPAEPLRYEVSTTRSELSCFRVLCCIVVFVCPRVARERAAARGVRGEPRALATSSRRPARGYLLGKAINPCLSLRQDNARARPLACLRVALVPRVTNKPLSPTTLIA